MRLGRRRAQQWLSPLRQALREIRQTGEITEADGHPVMEMPDAYVRIDHCIEGFTRMIARMLANVELDAIQNVRRKLASDETMTVAELDAALAEINKIEPLVARVSCEKIKEAVLTENIAIELDTAP